MKKHILSACIAFIICLGGVYGANPANVPSTIKPKWTLRLPNPTTLSDGSKCKVYGFYSLPSLVDSQGNAAYIAGDIYGNRIALWVSSKGVLLAAIPVSSVFGPPSILSVSDASLYVQDPEGFSKYTLVNGRVIKTLPPNGDYSSNYGKDGNIYTAPNFGLIGVTEIDVFGGIVALSCFLY